jgi:hypothetical protein
MMHGVFDEMDSVGCDFDHAVVGMLAPGRRNCWHSIKIARALTAGAFPSGLKATIHPTIRPIIASAAKRASRRFFL